MLYKDAQLTLNEWKYAYFVYQQRRTTYGQHVQLFADASNWFRFSCQCLPYQFVTAAESIQQQFTGPNLLIQRIRVDALEKC